MTEVTVITEPIFTNPDGREYPVMYSGTTQSGGEIKTFSVRVVSSDNEKLEYMAINPLTQKEVKLGATHWNNIYRTLLNREPPPDLSRRVKLYYQIKEQKSKELAEKNNLIYSPFENPEQIAA